MRAAQIDSYGGPEVIRVRDIETPRPGPDEVLVRVRACGVNPLDWRLRSGLLRRIYRLAFPATLGFDIAGTVESVGPQVSRWSPGDAVYGLLDMPRGGGFAEAVATPARHLAAKPDGLSFEEAAALPMGALTALQGLRDQGGLPEDADGRRVLINGGSGGVGHCAVQIATARGARVTATASEAHLPYLRSLGVERALDYGEQDFTRLGERWSVIFDVAAATGFRRCRSSLARGGSWITTLPGPGTFFWWALTRVAAPLVGGRRARFVIVRPSGADLESLAPLIDSGRLRPHVHDVLPLDRVADALSRLETESVRGSLVIRIDPSDADAEPTTETEDETGDEAEAGTDD